MLIEMHVGEGYNGHIQPTSDDSLGRTWLGTAGAQRERRTINENRARRTPLGYPAPSRPIG